MVKSKLIQTLKKMDKNEFFQLEKFVHSSFFNTNELITTFFDYFKNEYPDFNSPKLAKEKIYAHLFPQQSYDARKMIYLMADTYKLIVEFIGQMEYQTNLIAQKKLKANGLKKKGMLKEMHKELDAIERTIFDNPVKDLNYFSDLYDIESKRYTSGLPVPHPTSKKNLEAVMDYLDKFYALGKLQFGTEIISRQGILNEDYGDILFFEKVKKIVATGFSQENPQIDLFYNIIQLLETNDEQYYWELKRLFFEKQESLDNETKRDILSYLVNYTVKNNKSERSYFIQESYELTKFGFENQIYGEFIKNTGHVFHTLVINGSHLGEFEWLDNFMATVGNMPGQGYSDDIIIFAKANILYHKKDFMEARLLLLNYTFKREPDKVRAKSMLIKILYEEYLNDDSLYPLFLSTLQAFRRFLIRNKKLPHKKVVPYLNFLKYIKELSRYRFNRRFNERIKGRIIEKILLQEVASSNWILNKIDNLTV